MKACDISSLTVIGAGVFGMALAITAARHGINVTLWGRDRQYIEKLAQNNNYICNNEEVELPSNLKLSTDLCTAVASSDIILIALPSKAFQTIIEDIAPFLHHNAGVVWVTKGLANASGQFLHQVAQQILGLDRPLAVLSGPTFAGELISGQQTGIVLAAADITFATNIKALLSTQYLHIKLSSDMVGVQLCGALKNVIAIALGIADGQGVGANTSAFLITQGLVEMKKLGAVLGADVATFTGLAGLGDLILTCFHQQSRNFRFGYHIAKGQTVTDALAAAGQCVEGYMNTETFYQLVTKHHLFTPIIKTVYEILFRNKNPLTLVNDICTAKSDID